MLNRTGRRGQVAIAIAAASLIFLVFWQSFEQAQVNSQLIRALRARDVSAALQALSSGADANVDMNDTFWSRLNALLTHQPRTISAQTPLSAAVMIAIPSSGQRRSSPVTVDLVRKLLRSGSRVGTPDEGGTGLLEVAMTHSEPEVAGLLIDFGANTNVRTMSGETLLPDALIE